MKTAHQQRVEQFMVKAEQEIPDAPCIPSEEVRLLRAKLIIEEALETVEALGFELHPDIGDNGEIRDWEVTVSPYAADLVLVADGCADLSVVTIGTLSACGIHDKSLLEEVDHNNLNKDDGHKDESGKWIKASDHKPPDIQGVLDRQKCPLQGASFPKRFAEQNAQLSRAKEWDHLIALIPEALKRGWVIEDGYLHLVGDQSMSWAAQWITTEYEGQKVSIPHWLGRRMDEIAGEIPEEVLTETDQCEGINCDTAVVKDCKFENVEGTGVSEPELGKIEASKESKKVT